MAKNKKVSVGDILKSRYGSEENLPDWVHKRRSICDGCEWNSKNKPRNKLTNKEKLWITANHGKPTCLACKCMISAKTKIDYATCGLKEIGLEPKWTPIEEKIIKKTANVEIENLSTTPLKISEGKNGEIWLDYGTIKIGQETDVKIGIRDLQNNITDIEVGSSCGCTIPEVGKKGNQIIIEIQYDTDRVGDFTKSVVLSYKQNNIKFKKVFKITGKTE